MQLFMRRKRGRGIEQYSDFYILRHFLEFAANEPKNKTFFCFSFDTRHPRVRKHTEKHRKKVFCSCQKGEISRVHGRTDRAWIETINL